MIPDWWQLALLALASFRLTRLIGWDDFPLAGKARNRIVGAKTWMRPNTGDEDDETWVEYDRPLLAHFIACPFCQGFWVSVCVVAAWWVEPHYTLVACVPLAVSSLVGLTAKNLDA